MACLSSATDAADVIRAKIETETAWTGEAVPFIVTLYSPGPFSGTASFDLPELPRTSILRVGNPVVGSEEIEGESWLTQRHTFNVYTQQSGQVVIPPFQVRFEGKDSFTSDPEPKSGTTKSLHFTSKRPPGTEGFGVVVTASEMSVSQEWQPNAVTSVKAGDVIRRQVNRTATGTTAMMFPPIPFNAPQGVRLYSADPTVSDTTERGQGQAERADTVRYQFEAPGTFELPTIEIEWWNAETEELKRDSLPGLTVNVESVDRVGEEQHVDQRANHSPGLGIGLFVITSSLLIFVVVRAWSWWQEQGKTPEAVAANHVSSACRSNDAHRAYIAVMTWERLLRQRDRNFDSIIKATTTGDVFLDEVSKLATYNFAKSPTTETWSGGQLVAAFTGVRRALSRSPVPQEDIDLPPLNPSRVA